MDPHAERRPGGYSPRLPDVLAVGRTRRPVERRTGRIRRLNDHELIGREAQSTHDEGRLFVNSDRFVMRAGSVSGRAHRSMDQANQDAIYCHTWDGGLVAVVCDGCGSAPHSGMGAALGCRLTAGALVRRQEMLAQAVGREDAERYLGAVEADVLA